MRTIRMLALAPLIGAMFAAASGLAKADDNSCQPNPVPTQSCVSSAQVSFDGPNTTFQVVHATGKVNGKIQIRFAQPNGPTQAQMASVTKCWKAGPVTRNARIGERCGEVKIGTWYINSGFCIAVQKWCKFWDQVKSGDEFDMVGDQMHKKKCWNSVWFANSVFPKHMGHIFMPSQVDVRAHFSTSVTIRATSTSNAHAVSFAAAVCSVTANGVTASAAGMAYGEGKGTAYGYATATASSAVTARAEARNASLVNLEINKPSASATASSRSTTSAWSSAVVNVKCSVTPTQPPPSGPPPSCTGSGCNQPPPCSGNSCSPPPCSGNSCSPPPCSGNSCSPPPATCSISASSSKSSDTTIQVTASITVTSGTANTFYIKFSSGQVFYSSSGTVVYTESTQDQPESVSGGINGSTSNCGSFGFDIPAAPPGGTGGPGGPA